MPLVARLQIKTGLIWLILAMALGIFIYWPGGMQTAFLLKPVFYHMIMFGWVTQVIMGVAFWMFPRQSKEQPRGKEVMNWVTYYTLNAGLILRVIGEPMNDIFLNPLAKPIIVISLILQLIAGFAFVQNTWFRIRKK